MEQGVFSRKLSGVCVYVECRGWVVEGAELVPNVILFFLFFFLFLLSSTLSYQLLGTKTM